MANLARHLPLSQQPPGDETNITSDRRAQVASVVDEAWRLINAGPSDDRDARVSEFLAVSRLTREQDRLGTEGLDRLAASIRNGRKRNLKALARTVQAALRTAASLGVEPDIDLMVAGSAALWASGTAPIERRAAIRGHTVSANDAGWAFGHGPTLEGRALDIAAFLLGESDSAPRPRTLEP